MELDLLTKFIIISQLLLAVAQGVNCITKTSDTSRARFLILVILFITYNYTSKYFPKDPNDIETIPLTILGFSRGLVLGAYYLYYIIKELGLEQSTFFSVKALVSLLITSFIFGLLLPYLVTKDIAASIHVFLIFPVIIAFYFYHKTILSLFKKRTEHLKSKTPFRAAYYSGSLGIIAIATMPLTTYLGDIRFYNIIIVNIGFALALFAYLKHRYFQKLIQVELNYNSDVNSQNKINDLSQFSLTSRELEVAYMILQDLTYKEISEDMYIAQKTVSKHASNIFKKTNTKSLVDFKSLFKNKD